MASGDAGDLRQIGQQQDRGRVWRDHLPTGWLAVAQGDRVVTIADDVRCPDVAAVARHMATYHAPEGIEACRLPICAAVLTWRPSVAAEGDIASSA